MGGIVKTYPAHFYVAQACPLRDGFAVANSSAGRARHLSRYSKCNNRDDRMPHRSPTMDRLVPVANKSVPDGFKEKIKPTDKASEAILALKPVTFQYKHDLDPTGSRSSA